MTAESGLITGMSVSHTDATLEQLEQAAAPSQQEAVERLLSHSAVREAFVLQTCNRVEAYVVTDEEPSGSQAITTAFDSLPDEPVRTMDHEESLRHLLRVAAGLESLVIGEDQVLGQIRDAYEDAREAGGIGSLLETGVTKAIRVGERARTETAINEGVVSLASAAVKLAAEKHGLTAATAAVIGAGEMGTLAAKRLSTHVERLILANRTTGRAESLASTVRPAAGTVEPTGLDRLDEIVSRADIVISATGSEEWILDQKTLEAAGETFIVDITRPRDIPPSADEIPSLTLYDLDRLETVTEKTRKRRNAAANRVTGIIDEEFNRLLAQYKRERADEVISAMYEGAERIKARELEETFGKLDLDESQEAVIESMADSIVSQLLAPPTNSLRDAAENDDWTRIHTALQLFDPSFDSPASMPDSALAAEMAVEDIPEGVREQMPAAVLEQLRE